MSSRPRRVRQLSSNSVNSTGSLSWGSDSGQGFFFPRDPNSSMNSMDSSFSSTSNKGTPSNSPGTSNPRKITRSLRNIKRKLLLEQVNAASLEEHTGRSSGVACDTTTTHTTLGRSAASASSNPSSPTSTSESPRDDALMDELLKSWFQQNVFHEEE